MGEETSKILFDQFKNFIDILNPCIDDYIYIYDIKNDFYCISANALERFLLPDSQFHNVAANLKKLTYANDFGILDADLQQILDKEKNFHNLQYRWLDKNGQAVWINCRGNVILDEDDNPEFLVGCINEIGLKQKADNVSGLLGESSLQNEINNYSENRLNGFMLRLGIDNFKEVNENKGIDYGDKILHETATCIEAVMLPNQKLYRIVADEFVVMDYSDRGIEDAKALYERIRARINSFIEENGYEVFFTISAGILDFTKVEDQTYFNLMKWSEFALNEAKRTGKNKCCIFEKDGYVAFLRRRQLICIMRRAIGHNFEGFEAYFQPIMDIKNNYLFSAETLMRFHTEELGMVSPAEFIPLLEESGLIIPVGKWILYQAMEACSKIQKKIPDFRVNVNLSYVQVLKSNILDEIISGVKKYGLKPGSLVVELTESGFFETNSSFTNFCRGLKEYGIPLALDDFGTGYSNFHYLYNLSPNTIKIDRSFTLKALNNDYEYNLLQHMVDMTHSIDLKMCIEGIETKQELNKICEMGPDYIQGYYFGKPCALEQFMSDYIDNRDLACLVQPTA